jgi:hypothetical protein
MVMVDPSEGEREVVVDKEGNGDYTDLHNALADSQPGDVVQLVAGNYSIERLEFPSDDVTLKGDGSGRTNITFEIIPRDLFSGKSNITISSLSLGLKNIDYYQHYIYIYQKIIRFSNCSNILIEGCNIQGVRLSISSPISTISIRNNAFNTSLIDIESSWLHIPTLEELILENNTMDGKPLRFLKGERDLVLTGNSGGFILTGCENITIRDANLTKLTNGIRTYNSTNISVINCNSTVLFGAMVLRNTTGVRIINSIVIGEDDEIINYIQFSNVNGLIMEGNTFGVSPILYLCKKSVIVNNLFLNNSFVMVMDDTTIFRNNTFEAGGVMITPLWLYGGSDDQKEWRETGVLFQNNTVSGKPLVYFNSVSDLIISEDVGQVILFNVSNALIEGLEFNGTTVPITIMGSNNITIRDSKFTGNQEPISLYYSHALTIENCNFENSSSEVSLGSTNDSIIRDSRFQKTELSMWGFGNIIDNCTFQSSGWSIEGAIHGINVQGSVSIANVSVSDFLSGIHVHDANVTITNSSLMNNAYGIEYYGGNVSIRYCVIAGNDRLGVGTEDPTKPFKKGEVDARYNYWGNPSGPFNTHLNKNWAGDEVDDYVLFHPWFEDEGLTHLTQMKWNQEGDEDSTKGIFYILLVLLSGLFIILSFVVHSSKKEPNNRLIS